MSGTNSTTAAVTTSVVLGSSSSSSVLVTTTSSSRIVTTSSSVSPVTTSSVAPTTTAVTTTASSNVDVTSITTASTAAASTTVFTSVITSSDGTSVAPVTVVITATQSTTSAGSATQTSPTASSTTSATSLQNTSSDNSSSGLSTTGRTAIAVVVPVVAVALLVLAALFFWRKRKQRKNTEEARRKEVEEYGYNPNTNPTLPALASDGRSEMTEDASGGYRGWGGAAMANRKPSATLSAGHTQGMSDAGSNHGNLSASPTAFGGSSDGQHSEMYNHPTEHMTNDDLPALGAAPAAGANRSEMRRGPSNASSSYSAGHRSDHSDPSSSGPNANFDGLASPERYAYNQSGPYGDGSYGGAGDMPVVRDVSARRNTRIEQGGGYQQGNSGIAQNF